MNDTPARYYKLLDKNGVLVGTCALFHTQPSNGFILISKEEYDNLNKKS